MLYMGFQTTQVPGSNSSASRSYVGTKFFFAFLRVCGSVENEGCKKSIFGKPLAWARDVVDPSCSLHYTLQCCPRQHALTLQVEKVMGRPKVMHFWLGRGGNCRCCRDSAIHCRLQKLRDLVYHNNLNPEDARNL